MNKNHTSFDKLYRKVSITAKVKYISARRLELHQQLSQWTITGLSLALILLPLLQALGMPFRHTEEFLNAASIFLAVLILSYSLLLATKNYAVRASKIYSFELELGQLVRDLIPYQGIEHNEELYQKFSERYQTILEKYESHDHVDYLQVTLLKRYKNEYYPRLSNFTLAWIYINIRYFSGFFHYAIVFLGTAFIVYYLFTPPG